MKRPLIIQDDAFRVPRDGKDGARGPAGESVKGDTGEPGMQWAGNFSRRFTYRPGQVVGFEGSSYVCVRESAGHEPTSGRYFQPVALMGNRGPTGPSGPAGARGRSVNQWDLDARVTALENSDVGGTVTMSAIFDGDTAAGEVVFISGDGHVDLAQANSEPETYAVGIATADVLAGESGDYIPVGPVECETWSLVPGTVYYLDPDIAGGLTATYPTNVGDFIVILGAAATPTQLNLEIHWANYIEA